MKSFVGERAGQYQPVAVPQKPWQLVWMFNCISNVISMMSTAAHADDAHAQHAQVSGDPAADGTHADDYGRLAG